MSDLKLPEKFDEYAEGRKNGFLRVKAAKEAGKKVVGIFCTFTPVEVFDAAGLISVGLCGMSDETTADAERDLPKNLCPLIKASYGFALTEKCPYTYWSDLIVGETTCDGKKKMYELLGQLKDVYTMNLPQGPDRDYAKKMWAHEIRLLIDVVEKKFGIRVTDEQIREAAIKRNEFRRLKVELMELLSMDPAPISGYDMYKFLESMGFQFTVDDSIAAVKKLLGELKEQITSQPAAAGTGRKRILVTGCPIGGVLDKVVGSIEANGGQVVCYENCGGIKAARCFVDTDAEDIVEAIADAYLQIGCAVMDPNNRRKENIPELIKEFRVEGVVDATLQACHTYMIETYWIRKICEEAGVPYMSLETDYSQSDKGQIDTRIAAFIETI